MSDAISFVKSCLPLCHAEDDAWEKPMLFSILIHFLILAIGFLPSSIFDRSLDLDQAAFNEPLPPAAPLPPEPVVKARPAAISEHIQPPAPAPAAQIVSLRPRKAKKKVKKAGISNQEKNKINQAVTRLQHRLEQEKAAARALAAQQEAAQAANDAVARLRDSLRSNRTPTSAPKAVGSSSGSGRQNNLEATHKQYYVAVSRKIHEHWILPPLQNWSPKLKAVIVVHVRRDGIVTKTNLEQKSDNVYFNSFVEKTLKESLPLPPFPSGMDEDELEIGLVFHPGGLL